MSLRTCRLDGRQHTPAEAGTRVQMICAKSTGPLLKRKMTDRFVGSKKNQQDILRGVESLRQVILKELAEGTVVLPEAVSVAPEMARSL